MGIDVLNGVCSMTEWYYLGKIGESGPIVGTDLKVLADTGIIEKETLVRREGESKWRKAELVKGLFPEEKEPEGKRTIDDVPNRPPPSLVPKRVFLASLLGIAITGLVFLGIYWRELFPHGTWINGNPSPEEVSRVIAENAQVDAALQRTGWGSYEGESGEAVLYARVEEFSSSLRRVSFELLLAKRDEDDRPLRTGWILIRLDENELVVHGKEIKDIKKESFETE